MTAALARDAEPADLGDVDPADPDPARPDPAGTTRAALAAAVRRAERLGAPPVDTRPPLPVAAPLVPLLPRGLRRGSAVGVSGGVASTSLTLALVGAASGAGSWCALVGLPPLTAEALEEFGWDLDRVAVVPAPALRRPGGTGWATAVGALVDAVDVVVVRPPATLPDGDVRRLVARARSRAAVLVVLTPAGTGWPGLDVRLSAEHLAWDGVDSAAGHGRLRARQVRVRSTGRGLGAGRPAAVWLPAPGGGIAPVADPVVTPLRRAG